MDIEEINNRHHEIESRILQIHKELKTANEEQSRILQQESGKLTYEKCITLSEEAEGKGYVMNHYLNIWQVPGLSEERINEKITLYKKGYGMCFNDCYICDRYKGGKCVMNGMGIYSIDTCPIVEEREKQCTHKQKLS